jgi:hypothetical protein
MGNFGLNAARDMVSRALSDPYSPGKVDKFEAIDIKEKMTAKGGEASESAKAFLADQVQAGNFDAGGAAVMQDLFSAPTQSFDNKVFQQTDVAINALHKAVDFGFVGGVNHDNTVNGSENAGDVAGMAEKYLQKLNELAGESSNLRSIITATLDGGKLIKDPEKRLNSYLKALSDIKAKHNNNDQDMKRLASDAIQNIHTAVRSQGGQIMSNGSIHNLSRESIYHGAYRQLESINSKASDVFIRNQAPKRPVCGKFSGQRFLPICSEYHPGDAPQYRGWFSSDSGAASAHQRWRPDCRDHCHHQNQTVD